MMYFFIILFLLIVNLYCGITYKLKGSVVVEVARQRKRTFHINSKQKNYLNL